MEYLYPQLDQLFSGISFHGAPVQRRFGCSVHAMVSKRSWRYLLALMVGLIIVATKKR